jgi:hypothetical protein
MMASSLPNIYVQPEQWRDPALLPKKPTTFDAITASTSVPWVDPVTLPKTYSTHDAVTKLVTVEHPRNAIGDLQVYGGETYRFDGERWVLKS